MSRALSYLTGYHGLIHLRITAPWELNTRGRRICSWLAWHTTSLDNMPSRVSGWGSPWPEQTDTSSGEQKESQLLLISQQTKANKSVETNRRPASPVHFDRQRPPTAGRATLARKSGGVIPERWNGRRPHRVR